MFKQKFKKRKRMTTCKHPKHLFAKNKGKCACGKYYKDNGKIFRNKGNGGIFRGKSDRYVAGTTADFHYKRQKPTKKSIRRSLKKVLRK